MNAVQKTENCTSIKPPMSKMRRLYFARLYGRILILFFCFWLAVYRPEEFQVLKTGNFFRKISILHVLWVIWVCDMLAQLIPIQKKLALGAKKHFSGFFIPVKEAVNAEALRKYVVSTTKSAYKVMLLWAALIILIGWAFVKRILGERAVFLICVFFYVCDLICVLIWCPFRLIMKTRCCTTCRIFNWDHLMMFSPLLFLRGFYTLSLLLLAVAVWVVWELCVLMYPERFWEQSNEALRCTACTDKLCTQYCQKLR